MKLIVVTCVISATVAILHGAIARAQENSCAAPPACYNCQPVVQHIHKYRHHHHCAPPYGVVVPSMAMMPVMPMAMAPVAAVQTVAAPQAVAVQSYVVQAAPQPTVQMAQTQTVSIPVQVQYSVPASAQVTLTQGQQANGQAAAQSSDAELLTTLIQAARRQQAAAAAVQAKANAQAEAADDNSLETRVARLEDKVGRLEIASEKLVELMTRVDAKVNPK